MTPEGYVVRAVLEYLQMRGIFAWRNNTTGIYDQALKRYRPNHGLNGVADILAILPQGRFLAVECKSERGKLSDAQRMFAVAVNDAGGVYCVVRPNNYISVLDRIIKDAEAA